MSFPYLKSHCSLNFREVTKFRGSAASLTYVIKKTIWRRAESAPLPTPLPCGIGLMVQTIKSFDIFLGKARKHCCKHFDSACFGAGIMLHFMSIIRSVGPNCLFLEYIFVDPNKRFIVFSDNRRYRSNIWKQGAIAK